MKFLSLLCIPYSLFALNFYIAPANMGGNDKNKGTTIDSPFLTIPHAQEIVRSYTAKGLKEDCIVYLRNGEFLLDSTLCFTENDGGNDTYKVTYTAYNNEKPTISGGKKITEWQLFDSLNNIWYAKIPTLCDNQSLQSEQCKWFGQLYKNGKRLQRSRFPNKGIYLTIDSVFKPSKTIWFPKNTLPKGLANKKDIDITIFHSWDISKETIDTIVDGYVVTKDYAGVDDGGGYLRPRKGSLFFLENALEFIDSSEEWCLDRMSKTLYYKAMPKENPNDSQFIMPSTCQLFLIKGTDSSQVKNLNFKEIKFFYSRWEIRPDIGFDGGLFGHYYNQLADNPEYKKHIIPAAVTITHAEKCTFEKCTFEHIGQAAIALANSCNKIQISSCQITDIGSSGIIVGWRGFINTNGMLETMDQDWPNKKDIPINNTIIGNVISNCGQEFPSCCGIHVLFSENTKIVSNIIKNMPSVGIGIGFSWSKSPTSLKSTIVEENTIRNCFELLADGGAIYTLGNQQTLIIRNNIIENINGNEMTSSRDAVISGIFFDDGSSNIKVYSNKIKNCRNGNYHTNIHLVGNQLLTPGPIELKK